MTDNISPRIYICIPVFNRISYTLKCIESIKNQRFPDFRILICDDGSTDGTSETISKIHPDVIVIKGTGDLWWAGGTNLCIEKALELGNDNDYIYTLNNDTELLEDTIVSLLDLEKLFPESIIGSVNIFYEKPEKIEPSAFKRTNKYFFREMPVRIHKLGDNLPEGISYLEVDAFAGKGVLIPFKVIEKIGLFNSVLLPHYHADSELTLRARNAGYKLLYSYESKVLSHQYLTGTGTMNRNFFEFVKSFKKKKSAIHYESIKNFSRLVYGENYRVYLYWQVIRIILGYFKRFIKKDYR